MDQFFIYKKLKFFHLWVLKIFFRTPVKISHMEIWHPPPARGIHYILQQENKNLFTRMSLRAKIFVKRVSARGGAKRENFSHFFVERAKRAR